MAKWTNKSPRSFEPNGVVGLGIVAALNESNHSHDPFFSANKSSRAILAVPPRSTPIPIFNGTMNAASIATKLSRPDLENEDLELSEDYTRVISYIGNNLIEKREYFDDVLANETETSASCWAKSGLVSAMQQSRLDVAVKRESGFQASDFLNSCNLCSKRLHGLDIFMYRGEKAFCSAECRCKQISMDEHRDKCGSGVMKPVEYSASPCSSPIQCFAWVAAA